MKQVLTALIEVVASQASALQSLDERLSALEKTWLSYHSEREDDLNSHLVDERRAHQESAALLKTQFEELQALASSLVD